MPVWILLLLLPMGANHYASQVLDIFNNQKDCYKLLQKQDTTQMYVCVEIK